MDNQNVKQSYYKIEYLLVMASFGFLGLISRGISLPSPVVSCCRGLLGAGFIFCYAIIKGHHFDRQGIKANLVPMMISGFLMAGDHILFFMAFDYTTIATATLCYYIAPTFVVLFSILLLGERYTKLQLGCAGLALVGMVFVSGMVENGIPTFAEIKGIVCAVVAAVAYALIILMNKKFPYSDFYARAIIQLLISGLTCAIFSATGGYLNSISMSLKQILLLLLMGIVLTGVTYVLYFRDITLIPARTVAIFSYADPTVAVLVSAVFLSEPITIYGIIGAVLIIGSAMVSELIGTKKEA